MNYLYDKKVFKPRKLLRSHLFLDQFSILIAVFLMATTILPSWDASAFENRCPTVWQRSEGINLCIGTDNNDHIDGSRASDIIIGLAGDDLLRGGPDDDVLQ